MPTYAIQRVGDDLPLEPQGATDFLAFRQAIDAFPWATEHAKWDVRQEGSFPALDREVERLAARASDD